MAFPIATTIEAAASAMAVISLIWYGGRWSQRFDDLTKSVYKLSDTFDRFSEKVTERLINHEVRITVLEKDEE